MAILAAGSLSAAGRGVSASPQPPRHLVGQGRVVLSVSGTFVGTWRIVRQFISASTFDTPGTPTWYPYTSGGTAQTFSGPFSEVLLEPASGTYLAVEITSYTSGTLNYRFDQ